MVSGAREVVTAAPSPAATVLAVARGAADDVLPAGWQRHSLSSFVLLLLISIVNLGMSMVGDIIFVTRKGEQGTRSADW